MTPEILNYLKSRRPMIGERRTVLEIGSMNVNGSARSAIDHLKWWGVDLEKGPDVDDVVSDVCIYTEYLLQNRYLPNTYVACECLEHTRDPIATINEMKKAMWFSCETLGDDPENHKLVITSPSYHFGYHAYPRDYWRFSTDTLEDVFFDGLEILDLCYLDSNEGERTTVAGIARLKK